VQGHPVSVLFSLPADALPQLGSASSNGAVEVIAQETGGGDLAVGRLTVVDNRIDPINNTVAFKSAFVNANGALRLGQTVSVRILGYTAMGRVVP
jgi:multidrug efflux pump subunit AcrA (membrane-fusion protein)